mmetsp:Transcript_11939/g.18818  ORF Transcript_11939/g.18818 Transcript_11939/m.18818 type:complete len:286 (-) Transcript_11939:73-930(-)|eukprot:1924850-Rhodomonas_salina.5
MTIDTAIHQLTVADHFEKLLDAYPVLVTGKSQLALCQKWFANEAVLALDCEGKCLGRTGEISVIQLANAKGSCCVFDVLGSPDPDVVGFLKAILEDENIIKIIHDCRADSDALYHHLGIRLAGVHDTQAWHCALQPQSFRLNLNNMLKNYNCATNNDRDTNVYKDDPAFWCKRPMSEAMVAWAAADVKVLHTLFEAQRSRTGKMQRNCKAACELYLREMRDAVIEDVAIEKSMLGKLIGKGGANIKRISEETGAQLNVQDDARVVIVGSDKKTVRRAKKEIEKYM